MFTFRPAQSWFEKLIVQPIFGTAIGGIKGAFGGLFGRKTGKVFQGIGQSLAESQSASDFVQAAAMGAGETIGHVAGATVRGVAQAGTTEPVKAAVRMAGKGAAELTRNIPADAKTWGGAILGFGETAWNFLTEDYAEEIVEGGQRLLKEGRRLRPGIVQGAVPAALALGVGMGWQQGEISSSMGYIHNSQMPNLTNAVQNPTIRRSAMKMPYSYGADGNLVFAMHNLRNG